jgi:gliding motility-associated-like protein
MKAITIYLGIMLLNLTFSARLIAHDSPKTSAYFIQNLPNKVNEAEFLLRAQDFSAGFFKDRIIYKFQTKNNGKAEINSLQVNFIDVSSDVELKGSNELTAKSNFIIGNDPLKWATDLSNFQTITYDKAYKNIDLVYHSTGSSIKCDFMVHPGGNISDIKFRYEGISSLKKDKSGNLIIKTKNRNFNESIPAAYQEIDGRRQKVKVHYHLYPNNSVGFIAEDYDPDLPLIIDPELIFSTFYGGSGDDLKNNHSYTRDNQGNLYITGRTNSSNFTTTPGAYDNTFGGGAFDTFIMKLSPDGTTPLFSTYLGGNGYDYGCDVAVVEPTHELIILGGTNSLDFPSTAGVYKPILSFNLSPDSYDLFITKLNSTGSNILFSTFIGNEYDDEGGNIRLDQDGNIVACGYCGPDLETSAGCFQAESAGDYDGYVFLLNPDATDLLFATYIGGIDRERIYGITLDNDDNVYITGSTGSTDFPITSSAYQQNLNSWSTDAFICKFNPTLSNLIYSTYIGGPYDDIPQAGILLDLNQNAIISGFCSYGFPITQNAFSNTFNGGTYDAFVTKVNASGSNLLFSTYIGGTGDDRCTGFDIDSDGNIYLTGDCQDNFPFTRCTYDSTYNGNTDCFITKLNGDASEMLFSTFIGGSDTDRAYGIISQDNEAIVICETNSSDFPVTPGAFDNTYNSGTDLAYLKLFINTNQVVAEFSSPISACIGEALTFEDNSASATSYLWDFGDGETSLAQNPVHTYAQYGNFQVNLIASNGCTIDTISHLISISNTAFYIDTMDICSGDSAFLAGAYRYQEGVYNDTIPISGSCDSISSTVLQVQPIFADIFADSISLCDGNTIKLDAGYCYGCTYFWSDGSIDRYLEIAETGKYWVEKSFSGCTVSDSIKVIPCTSFRLPNVFSPNNDGLNDRFRPVGSFSFNYFQMEIYNRWGQRIFVSNDAYYGWDGRCNGVESPSGVYYYVILYESIDNSEKKDRKQGSITLLR